MNRSRQLNELALLSSMYPSEFHWRYPPSPTSPSSSPSPLTEDLEFSIEIQPGYTLAITLPPTYPEKGKPGVYLSCGGNVGTGRRKEARSWLRRFMEEMEEGEEGLDVLVSGFLGYLLGLEEEEKERDGDEDRDGRGEGYGKEERKGVMGRVKRVVIWSHHLLATSKRRDIRAWSKELRLGGYARPGYPGAVFVEGEEGDVDEFVGRVKGLRWQALQIRAEVVVERRVCGMGTEGVTEVEKLSDVVDGLKGKEDCEGMFLEAMRIGKSDGAGG